MTQQNLFDLGVTTTPTKPKYQPKVVFNTNFMTQSQVELLEKSAVSQAERVLAYLRKVKKAVGANEVYHAVKIGNEPNTSFRRALNTLEKQGLVRHLKTQTTIGGFGKNETLWEAI